MMCFCNPIHCLMMGPIRYREIDKVYIRPFGIVLTPTDSISAETNQLRANIMTGKRLVDLFAAFPVLFNSDSQDIEGSRANFRC